MMEIKPIEAYLKNKLPNYLELLHQMVAINSFTSNPDGINHLGEITAEMFADMGFLPEYIPSNNPLFGKHLILTRQAKLAGALPSSMPTIALISHLDTVFPPEEEIQNNFHWREEGDRIYGPGVIDIKGGTLMIFVLFDLFQKYSPNLFDSINWFIGLDATEEVLSADFGKQCLSRLPTTTLACLVFEGGTAAYEGFPLVVSRKGRATFHVQVEGRAAHAGNAHAYGANAIHQLALTIQEIEAFTDYQNQITFNVGTANGGSVVNRVPHTAEAQVEMRAFSPDIFQSGIEKMEGLQNSPRITSEDGFACRVSVDTIDQSAPWPSNPGTEQLFRVWGQAAQHLGKNVFPEHRGGLSDGNLFWQNFPTLDGLGPTGANAHCSEYSPDGSKEPEYLVTSSLIPKAILNYLAINNLIQDHKQI